ncbi:MAG TPA: dihydrofolate reductase [Candidatus Merdicola faecigallinarum]|uniref:Dihydrofolate reductase n=1 Tax=Candidatus Merdicola faecigallinarum TaxID=2840862 RepID=A0A9D1M2B0_9FIRM|nr:dihydrofolate reductase [Candidatus Merdicola faecigallinarum]
MKRKVILYISQSLDGFISDNKGSVDWILGNNKEYIGDYGYNNFIKNIDTIILGANTYKQIKNELSPDKWVYEDLQSYVLTNEKIKDTINIKYVNINIKELINRLQQEKGKNIWICGGANLVNQCIKENLIDEYQITTVPVILGNGIRLFEENNKKIRLELKEIKEENGLIMGIYAKR